MVMLLTSALFVSLSCILAWRANKRFRAEVRIPMQWGFTGAVNWSPPRRIAFAFMPIFTIAILGFQAVMSINVRPRPGQEGFVLPVFVGSGLALIAIQLGHNWLIGQTMRRRDM